MTSLHPSGTRNSEILRGAAFSDSDLSRLDSAIRAARLASTESPASLVAPAVPGGRAAPLTERACTFDHCAVLLFPRTCTAGLDELGRRGLAPLPAVPSVVVRGRLSQRYGLDMAQCDVEITRLCLPLPDGRNRPAVEVFLFPRDRPGYAARVEASEAEHGFERHTALAVRRPAVGLLAELITAWRAEAGLVWEGGGHNPYEGGPDGATVFYFVRNQAHPGRPRRIELNCTGDLRAVIGQLTLDTEAVKRAYAEWRRPAAQP